MTRARELDPRRPVHAFMREARELHEVEDAGESAWTPVIAIVGLVLLFAGIFVFMLVLADAAYYLIR